MKFFKCWILALFLFAASSISNGQEILPFPPTPSASTPGLTMQDSEYRKREEPMRLPEDSPNILIILIDDVGPATPTTYGGEINTPALSRVASMGISYNRFHTTAMCSPTRAALLTGRNHTRVGNGQISAIANDFDGFSGIIPKSSATIAEVLKAYGYNTAAFGKWHNTPEEQITNKGPFDFWPTGYGFEYFYGFLAGEASQYEPTLVRNTTYVTRPEKANYHLSDDLADDAIRWLHDQKTYAPDKPFFVYWAPGASHGPHQVPKQWADKYQGKFDDGWDEYRKRSFARQKKLGWIPDNTRLTPRPATLAAWDSIPESEKPFQRRLMEVFAGFTEHADHNAGRVIDAIDRLGELENTLIFYIWGDNGSSAEGLNGTISEQLAQNGIQTEVSDHLKALEELGGIDALGGNKTDNMYHAGWAWAGSTPYRSTKLVGAHFGGTRNPMAVSWPRTIKTDSIPRPQFHHVIDIVPTIYDVLNIGPPRIVNGFEQESFDGVSMTYSFDDPSAKGARKTQFFDIMASRGIYHDGWFAAAMGPREPWVGGIPKGARNWTPEKDNWELYNLENDWSQAIDLAEQFPDKLETLKQLFLLESTKNKNLPIGGGLWATALFHPEDAPAPKYRSWKFMGPVAGTPESAAPKLGKVSSQVAMQIEHAPDSSGVLYALAGFSGGITCYIDAGHLCYEFNLFEIERTRIKSNTPLPSGNLNIVVESKLVDRIGGPMDVTLKADGKVIGSGRVPRAMSLHFTSNATFDIGCDQDSPVSLDYFDRAPFAYSGKISTTVIDYLDK